MLCSSLICFNHFKFGCNDRSSNLPGDVFLLLMQGSIKVSLNVLSSGFHLYSSIAKPFHLMRNFICPFLIQISLISSIKEMSSYEVTSWSLRSFSAVKKLFLSNLILPSLYFHYFYFTHWRSLGVTIFPVFWVVYKGMNYFPQYPQFHLGHPIFHCLFLVTPTFFSKKLLKIPRLIT